MVDSRPFDQEESSDKIRNGILSLTHIARLKCINNAHIITDIGCTPYHLIEPVLKKKTAKSLKQIELQSPQIIADSEELWKELLKRDFPDRPLAYITIENGTNNVTIPSRQLYDRYLRERELQRQNAVGNLKQITQKLKEMKNKNKLTAIDRALPSGRPKQSFRQAATPTKVFKSSMLQKARTLNKQRVRNFIQPGQNKVFNPGSTSNGTINLTKLGSSIPKASLPTSIKRVDNSSIRVRSGAVHTAPNGMIKPGRVSRPSTPVSKPVNYNLRNRSTADITDSRERKLEITSTTTSSSATPARERLKKSKAYIHIHNT